MRGLFMSRVSLIIGVFWLGFTTAQVEGPFADILSSNSDLWKTFQEEMKTLEEAAHKMNTLLVKSVHSRVQGDQGASSEDSEESTTKEKPVEDKETVAESDEMEEDDDSLPGGGVSRPIESLNFDSLLGFFRGLSKPWWQGKNVCTTTKTEEEEKKNGTTQVDKPMFMLFGTGTFQHCRQTPNKYTCTTVSSGLRSKKSVTTTKQCCEGFRRFGGDCKAVSTLDLVKTVSEEHSRYFGMLMESQDIMRVLGDRNITVFAPQNSAMNRIGLGNLEFNQIERARRLARAVEEWTAGSHGSLGELDMIKAHMTDGLIDKEDFTNDMVVKSLYKDTPLRINVYPGEGSDEVTVNCAHVLPFDRWAQHGRVYVIESVLQPVTQSVLDILSQPRFSQFKKFLEQEGLLETLANASTVTVFAPNNEAWDKLGNGLRDKFSRGEACINKVLRHHIVPLTLCSRAVALGRRTTWDVNEELVHVSMQDGQLMVDDKGRAVRADIVATNGVVHELDKVLSPKSAKPLSDLLQTSNHTTWLSLLDRVGLLDKLNKQENITMFVPTEQALREENTSKMLDAMDPAALKQVLLNHVTEKMPGCNLRHKTELRMQDGNTLRITTYKPLYMTGLERVAVQCVPLGHESGQACHAVAYEVTRLLLPPNGTVLQLVSTDPQLSSLKQALQGTEIEKELEERSELLKDGFTLLAPTNDAFSKLHDSQLTKLLTDKIYADEVIRHHLLKDVVCCASITAVPWPFTNYVRSLDMRRVEVSRNRRDRVEFGDSTVDTCDIIASDGIIHTVDSVMLPEARELKIGNVAFGSPDKQIMLFGI